MCSVKPALYRRRAHDGGLFETAHKKIADFKNNTEAQGLENHPDKTQILTSPKTNRTREVEIDGMHVETLPHEGKVKYLGHMITIVDQESTEITTQKPARMVRIRQTSTGTDIPILLTTTHIIGEKDIRDDETCDDTQEEDSTQDEYDQDSNISLDENIRTRKKLMEKC